MILWFYGIGVIAGGMLLPGMLKLLGQRIGLMACLAGLMFNFGLFHSDFFRLWQRFIFRCFEFGNTRQAMFYSRNPLCSP